MGNGGSSYGSISSVDSVNRYSRSQTITSWSSLSNANNSGNNPTDDVDAGIGDLALQLVGSNSARMVPIGPVSGEHVVKKRRNLASFATLRRKLGRKTKRSSRTHDHGQVMKEFINSWTTRDIAQLVEQYDAESIIKELHLQAEIARPSASTVAQDLAEIFDTNYVADSYLFFEGHSFPVHKAIVCVRCPLFRELLGKVNEFGAQVNVSLDVPGLRPDFFLDLLRYLYSGELYPSSAMLHPQTYDSILMRLSDKVPNSLEQDLRTLFETGLYSDAILVFNSPTKTHFKKCRACSDQNEFSCHGVVLASRSTFFRNMIIRHQKRFLELQNASKGSINTANQKIRIVIDESIIPRRFGRIILHCIYRDYNELASLLPGCVCKCQTGETVQASTSKYSNPCSSSGPTASSMTVYAKEIMELYEIGRFLELDSLVQGCEDMILDSLTLDNLVPILKWSEQPHGSLWVKRQALCFLREEFSIVASSSTLYDLDASHLKEVIRSDYLQASELEVLQALIKWGENKLMRKMEEREPNVTSQTSHSLRHGFRKRELNDEDLRDTISELMPLVRIGHIIPPDSETLANAIKRGLVSILPPYMLEEDNIPSYPRGLACWIRGRSPELFIKPRYFTPYVEEARNVLESRLTRPNETIFNRSSRSLQQPDTLYMVEEINNGASGSDNYSTLPSYTDNSSDESMILNQLPVLQDRVITLMQQRMLELERYISTSRDLDLIPNKNEITHYLKLRVVREFALPDTASSVLNFVEKAPFYSRLGPAHWELTSSRDTSTLSQHLSCSDIADRSLRVKQDVYSHASELNIADLNLDSMNLNPSQSGLFRSNTSLVCEEPQSHYQRLSELAPDIAMTSTPDQMNLHGRSRPPLYLYESRSSLPRRSRSKSNH